MAVNILSPVSGDTVDSPVTVTVSYSVGSNTCALTVSIGQFTTPSPQTITGDGTYAPRITVPVHGPTPFTVTAVTNPDFGSDSQPNVMVTAGP